MSESLRIGAFLVLGISLGYLLLFCLLIGFWPKQLVLIGFFTGCYYASGVTRRFALGFSIFIVFWIIYGYMKAFSNYTYHSVDIGPLYDAKKSLFDISFAGCTLITYCETGFSTSSWHIPSLLLRQ